MSLPESLDTPEGRKALADWIAYRKERKPALKSKSIEALVKKWAKDGSAVFAAAVEHSISNGWQGLFAPKASDTGSLFGGGRPGRVEAPPGKYDHLDGPGTPLTDPTASTDPPPAAPPPVTVAGAAQPKQTEPPQPASREMWRATLARAEQRKDSENGPSH